MEEGGGGHNGADGRRRDPHSNKAKARRGELVLCMNLRLARSVDIVMVAKAGYDAPHVDR
jgi:hypothetical protein